MGKVTSIGIPDSADLPKFRTTYGETLEGGTVIDLVAEGDELRLCHWDGKQVLVVPYFSQGNVVYRPPKLTPSLREAIRFPARRSITAPCARFSMTRLLFSNVGASKA